MTVASNGLDLRVAAIGQHVTIFDVFERMGVDVTPETQQMRCPFHADTSPSARVYADQNKIYCFSCGKSWDVVAAVMDHWKLAFPDAVVWIEDEFAVPGGTASLRGTIRAKLAAKPGLDIKIVAAQVEASLFNRRYAIGFDRYTKLLWALDLTVFEHSERPLKPDLVQQRMTQILNAAR